MAVQLETWRRIRKGIREGVRLRAAPRRSFNEGGHKWDAELKRVSCIMLFDAGKIKIRHDETHAAELIREVL
jgi:hypothetical protein